MGAEAEIQGRMFLTGLPCVAEMSYISAVVQVLRPEDDTAHNGRGLPTSVSSQESARLSNLMQEIPQLRFPFPSMSKCI